MWFWTLGSRNVDWERNLKKQMGMIVYNTPFKRNEQKLVTYESKSVERSIVRGMIDFLLVRRHDFQEHEGNPK